MWLEADLQFKDALTSRRDRRSSEQMTTGGVIVRSHWSRRTDSSLFATFVAPRSGAATGAIVMCPSVGKEYSDTYRGMYAMARHLAGRGVAALLIDYPGTGDSPPLTSAVSVIDAWVSGVCEAVEWLRDSGIEHVGVLGLRAGALIAGAAAERTEQLSSVTYWDPVDSGRAFLREQRLRARMQGFPGSGLWGQHLPKAAIDEFSALELPMETEHTLVVGARSQLLDTPRYAEQLIHRADIVIPLNGQQEFVTPQSFVSTIPFAAITEISESIRRRLPTSQQPFVPLQGSNSVEFMYQGQRLTETIERLGRDDLFAISTTRGDSRPSATVALIAQAALEPHTGPGAMWTTLARELAADGVDAVRFDRRGMGLSGDPATDSGYVYSRESKRDISSAAETLRVRYGTVLGVGSCSGAWHSAYAARRGALDGLALANFTFWPTRIVVPLGRNTLTSGPVTTRVGECKRAHRARVPRWLAGLLARVGLVQSPAPLIRVLAKQNVPTSIMLVDEDLAWFRNREAILGQRDWASVEIHGIGLGDHGLYWTGAQASMQKALREAVAAVSAADEKEKAQ